MIAVVKCKKLSEKGPCVDFRLFGNHIEEENLAAIVCLLFENATAKSTRVATKTGKKQFREFSMKSLGIHFKPKAYNKITLRRLLLCFFSAELFQNIKNFKNTTIRNLLLLNQ